MLEQGHMTDTDGVKEISLEIFLGVPEVIKHILNTYIFSIFFNPPHDKRVTDRQINRVKKN